MTLADQSSTSQAAELTPRSRWHGARMTLDEFLTLPEQETSLEYEAGLVTEKMPPQADHGSLQFALAKSFDRAISAGASGRVFTETRFVTPGWAPVPDVSYYRRGRIRARSRQSIGDLQIPPDIAVEILSPDQTVGELLRKCVRYASVGVILSLIVDTEDRSVYLMRSGQPLLILRGHDRIDLDDILPGIDLTVEALFASIVDDWMLDEDDPEAQV